MEIREATASDSDAIFELANLLHESMSVSFVDFQCMFAHILQRKDSFCFVSSDGSKVLGYVSGCVRPVLIQGKYSAYIDEMVVLPDNRGSGVGSSLMAHMEVWAREQQCALIGLATGGASLFYEQHGYHTRAGYYKKYL